MLSNNFWVIHPHCFLNWDLVAEEAMNAGRLTLNHCLETYFYLNTNANDPLSPLLMAGRIRYKIVVWTQSVDRCMSF